MSSLYPSLEDMKVDQMARAQMAQQPPPSSTEPSAPLPYPLAPNPTAPTADLSHLYPSLQEYMGLELTPEVIAANMPEYAVALPQESQVAVPQTSGVRGMIAPISGESAGLTRAEVTHGIREIILCKDGNGKVGLRVRAINKGVFICLVEANSAASLAGLRFGDQILQICGENVAGYSMDKVHDLFRKAPVNGIVLAIRDRPFERTVTMHKDSTGHIGFQFKNGKIISLAKDSSAARNGLLIEHQLMEINGQNVVGLGDKETGNIIDGGGRTVTVTIMPTFMYDHMVKKMATSLVKKLMDHSIPDL